MGAVVLVTGGNVGIGFEVVRALAQRGMTVYLGSRDVARGEAAAAELASVGDIRPVRIEMKDEATFAVALAVIERDHGRLDILVNNAGFNAAGLSNDKGILTIDEATIREEFDINLHGPVRLTQLAVPLLRKSKAGRIVNVTSRAGQFSFLENDAKRDIPYSYCVSKTALNAATVLFANALEPDGIKVNACNPGYVKTKVTSFLGTRSPEQGAQIIIALATLPGDGPSGGFFDDTGKLGW